MALTKADFAEQLFDELGLKKREGKDIVELFFEEIKRTLYTSPGQKLRFFKKLEAQG